MTALTEYKSLDSIKSKLAFNADGRSGVVTIRKDQSRLREKISTYCKTVESRLNQYASTTIHHGRLFGIRGGLVAAQKRPLFSETRKNNVAEWTDNRRLLRTVKVGQFLNNISLYKHDIEQGCPRELFNLPISCTDNALPTALGRGWFYLDHEEVSWDNDCYSKSWHRKYGGKKTVDSRIVNFKRKTKRGIEIKTAYLDTWAGDWLARAVIQIGLHPTRKHMPSLKIRLNKAYDAKLIDVKRGYKIYQRTLVGKVTDYVIQSPLGMIYHDEDRSNLVKGLHNKIRNQSRKLQGLVDWKMCRKLGFCKEGIKSFCDKFGFDTTESYTPQEIERAVRSDVTKASPFLQELQTLANALNYETNWN